MRKQLFRYHLGNHYQCKEAKKTRVGKASHKKDNKLINRPERVIKSWLVDQTKSTLNDIDNMEQ